MHTPTSKIRDQSYFSVFEILYLFFLVSPSILSLKTLTYLYCRYPTTGEPLQDEIPDSLVARTGISGIFVVNFNKKF